MTTDHSACSVASAPCNHHATLTIRRTITADDIKSIHRLTQNASVFSREEVDMASALAEEALLQGEQASGYSFVIIEKENRMLGYTCFGAIPLTQSSYDLYWIVVASDSLQQGVATALLHASENAIALAGGTQVYAETSSRQDYAPAHAFYIKSGFVECARQADFYAPGDDKITFVKKIKRRSIEGGA